MNKTTTSPLRFLDEDQSTIKDKAVTIIPAPLAKTTSWIGGTDEGPLAILAASEALESFDDELHCETWRVGIDVLPPLDFAGMSSEEACQAICLATARVLGQGRFPVLLGGEHTVTVPAVAAVARKFPSLHVVQIDAHLDLRDSYEGSQLSHACVMQRVDDLGLPYTQVGSRSFSMSEWEFVREHGNEPFYMSRIKKEPDWIEKICARINGPVYLTIDVDCFDPAVMPATGTPEPDGMSWQQLTDFIRQLAACKEIVGFDLVEFSPQPGAHHAAFTAAKIIYRTLGYVFQKNIMKGDKA